MEKKDKLGHITRRRIGAASEVHKSWGPGLLGRAGRLIDFHLPVPENGPNRIVNRFPDSAVSR